ncbi:Glycosyltransferase, catalytic subunit of cellulose synthase and poly-beta-1,6-N-acetylglucosamine synthase [Clostridium collagenovorans DSM 3089]|uniref:Glycosyltransferase, catalytic subunit of cellulose synthase and poly-beta-1,6-N-acetylglucosamine synthase n=1 Tax=Clostridium collagenovorans DSM 3089 TaxID=1121306 RepID=A0A1M5X3D2_9CLOT|nr:glycosyltransferase family 2 protein [Clostridium collagenovorans]SHH94319.1 Glycosyltransferase, catalytic subunit of cellulose synthase and poly-beta-1,6-N-acetylglucosamine synthase [Clostridium collagenovorans DSM 3089]
MEYSKYPFVTAIIVFRNEEKYIERCFKSFIEQSYFKDKYEIILIDGESDDNSNYIIEKLIEKNNSGVEIRYYKNPKRSLASGWNMAIKSAKGEYVVRIDAHGYADKDFIKNSVDTMLNMNDVACVGGSLNTECYTGMGKRIAMVLSSPFGVGNSKFRYSQKAEYVDTVAFGLYRKSIFDKVGYFDENLKRNQDNDMHRRIKEAGYKFYLNPSIKSTYISRDSVKGFLNQAWQNGKWNMKVLRNGFKTLNLRHIIPLMFVLNIILLLMLGIKIKIMRYILIFIIILHFILGIIFSIYKTNRLLDIVLMPIMFISLHISYGLGSIRGLFELIRKK